MESLEQHLEGLQSYFESSCTVYKHAITLIDRIECLAEIDSTLDEANDVRKMLGRVSTVVQM